jgi:hypothetical protein
MHFLLERDICVKWKWKASEAPLKRELKGNKN